MPDNVADELALGTGNVPGATPAEPAVPIAPVVNIDEIKSEYEKQIESYQRELEPYRDYFRKQDEQKLAEMTAELFGETVATPNALTDTPAEVPAIKPENKAALTEYVKLGYEYKNMKPQLDQRNLAQDALVLAASIVGDDATVGQLVQQAAELAKLGDKRLMEQWTGHLINQKRSGVATQRVTSGVDAVIAATGGGAGALSPESVGTKIAEQGVDSLSSEEKRVYARDRKNKGWPFPSGWLE